MTDCSCDLISASIVQSDLEVKLIKLAGVLLQLPDLILEILIKGLRVPNDPHPHLIIPGNFNAFLHIIPEQLHQTVHLFPGPFPVLCGKSVYSQILDP